MTPGEVKLAIHREYLLLKRRGLSDSTIANIIAARCREGARHNGVPEAWRNYLPEELREEYS